MTKFKIHFAREFCNNVEECGLSKRNLLKLLKVLRENPFVGEAASPKFPSYRVWHTMLDGIPIVIGFTVAQHYADVDLSFVMLDASPNQPAQAESQEPQGPVPGGSAIEQTLSSFLLLVRLVAMIVKVIREFVSLVT